MITLLDSPFVFIFVLLAMAPFTEAGQAFGTDNGFDAGGTEPMCWSSTLQNYVSGDIDEMNQELFREDSLGATLLPSCFDGTNLEVLPLDVNEGQVYTGHPYTFSLTLKSNVTAIDPDIALKALEGKSTIYARLQLCDAVKQGFCNPLWDSAEVDARLTRSETDVTPVYNQTKYKYQQGNTLKAVELKTMPLVFSRWVTWTLKELSEDSPLYKTTVNITLQLPQGIRRGAYFFIGHAVMKFDLSETELNPSSLRVDVAQALPENVVEVSDPPTIRRVSDTMKYALLATIAVVGGLAATLLVFLLTHMSHPVLNLAQGGFLAAATAGCVAVIVFSFIFLPINDMFCTLSGTLELAPMTFVGACLIGRVWRVYYTLSNVQSIGKTVARRGECFMGILTFLARFMSTTSCTASGVGNKATKSPRSSAGFRRIATASETATLVAVLTMPQVVLQGIVAIVAKRHLVVEIDPSGSIGRVVCGEKGRWAFRVGVGYLATVYLLAVMAAWISRTLPSAFNEKDQIFHAASISTLLAFMTISLVVIMDDPTTEPDIQVFLRAALSIGVSCSVLVLIVWPKVRRVMSGEKVVMSAILGARYGSQSFTQHSGADITSSDGAAKEYLPTMTPTAAARNSLNKVALKKDDPLPASVERKLLETQGLLRNATDKFTEGRPLSAKEIASLQGKVASLSDELNHLEFEEPADRCAEHQVGAQLII